MTEVIASLEAVIGANISGLQRGLREADRGLSGFAQSMEQRLDRVGASMQRLGAGLVAMTAPLVAFGAQGVRVAASFESAMAEISARTGIVGADLQQISDFALKMGADTAFSAQQAAEAFLQLLSSGQSAAEAMQTLPSVLTAAAASGEDLGRTADQLTDILAAFGLGTRSAASVVEILAKGAGASSATMGSLAEGFANVGGIAHEFGLSVNETTGILALFSERGIKGAEAGTQLRSMLNQMTRDTEESRAAWAKLGTSMFDATGKARPIAAVMRDIRNALKGMTQEERIGVIKDLAGSYGQLGLAALTSGSSLEDMLGLMGKSASAAEVAAARMNTFEGRVESLRGSIETLQIKAMTPFMNALKPVIDRATTLINRMGDWAEANPELTSSLIQIVGAVAGLGAGLLTAGTALRLLAPALGILFGPAGMIAVGIAATVVGVGVLATALGVDLGAAIQSLIGFVETNLPLLPFYFEYYAKKLWSVVQPALQPVLDWFSGTGENSLGGAVQAVKGWVEQNVIAPLRGIWILVQPEIQKVVNWFNTDFLNAVTQVGNWVSTHLIAPLQSLWTTLQPVFQQIGEGIKAIFQPVLDFVGQALDTWEMIRRMGGGTPQRALPGEVAPGISVISGQFLAGLQAFSGGINTATHGAQEAFNHLATQTTKGARSAQEAFDNLTGSIDTGAKKIGKAATEAGKKITGDVDTLSELTRRTFESIGYRMGQGINGMAASLNSSTPAATGALAASGQGIGAALMGFSTNLLSASAQAIANMQRVGAQIGAMTATAFGGGGTQNMNLIGTAYGNPQVNADRTAAILAAYRNYYYPARALGGPVDAGQTYLVGERGPELYTPSRSGAIVPHGQSETNLADEVVQRLLAALLPGGVPSARLREVIVNRVLEELALG